jgi:hypothetical protein
VAGERAADLGVRLSYAGIEHVTGADPRDALRRLPPGEVDVVANYTAFLELREDLQRPAVRRWWPGRRAGSGRAAA